MHCNDEADVQDFLKMDMNKLVYNSQWTSVMLKNWGRLTLQGFDQSDIHKLNIDIGGGNDDSWCNIWIP